MPSTKSVAENKSEMQKRLSGEAVRIDTIEFIEEEKGEKSETYSNFKACKRKLSGQQALG